MNVIFGPVSSRRFGVSLGVDLSPVVKSCNFDCIYCELTAAKPVDKIAAAPDVAHIINELKFALKTHSNIDVITLTANGEPTLYPHLNTLIKQINLIKGSAKTLILSNGSGVINPQIYSALLGLDIVKFSLDSAVQRTFERLDRPLVFGAKSRVQVSELIAAMAKFRREFKGELVLEVLVVKGLNDTLAEFEALNLAIREIYPTRVDVSTIDRPPAYPVKGVSGDVLRALAQCIRDVPCMVASAKYSGEKFELSKEELIELLRRRPQSENDVKNSFSIGSEANLHELMQGGVVKTIDVAGVKFYRLV